MPAQIHVQIHVQIHAQIHAQIYVQMAVVPPPPNPPRDRRNLLRGDRLKPQLKNAHQSDRQPRTKPNPKPPHWMT